MQFTAMSAGNKFNIQSNLIICVFLLALSFGALQTSKNTLRSKHQEFAQQADRPPLYLPDAKLVKLTTLGFNNLTSNILWFNTNNYFGKQYLGNKDYKWLSHMCHLVTSLNDKAEHVFEFCGSMLSWIAKKPEKSNEILYKAIEAHPKAWRFYYMRGFNYWYFLEDKEKAREDFETASKLPKAPAFLASLASRLMVDTKDPRTAISFLKDLKKNTEDETVKKALEEKIKLGQISLYKRKLKNLVSEHEQTTGRKLESLEQLVTSGKLNFVPKDPFDGKFYLNKDTGEIETTSEKKGLEFFGKTAKTGVLKNEFESK